MRGIFLSILVSVLFSTSVFSQNTLANARKLYRQGNYQEALPMFESEHNLKPNDASISHWYGVCLFETGGDMNKAKEVLEFANKKRVKDSYLYLGMIYLNEFNITGARSMFNAYDKLLRRIDVNDRARLEGEQKKLARFSRIVSNTEDVQIIDSVVVDKKNFLSAYKMSQSTGKLDYYNEVFDSKLFVNSTVYINEKETKIYYARPVSDTSAYSLFSMDRLLDSFGNEKQLSKDNFGLEGRTNYPFMMADGVTIYFAAEDESSIGGYDLFVSRYNMNNDTYLNPERLNAPYNSPYNDYMMVIDEFKGVGWFASDRFQDENNVCIYTFIPNDIVRTVDGEDEDYLANRALITSIKDTWREGINYKNQIDLARKVEEVKEKIQKDFTFVVNDDKTYYTLKDFSSSTARNTYVTVMKMEKEYAALQTRMESERELYATALSSERKNSQSIILKLEKEIDKLRTAIHDMTKLVRKQELNK